MQDDRHAQSVVTPGETVTRRERRKDLTTSLRSLCGVLLLMASMEHSALADEADNSAGQVLVDATLAMTCFPPPPPPGTPPGIGAPPPCIFPQELDPKFVSPNPSGQAQVLVRDDDTARIRINLKGLAPHLVVTAWLAYYFPPGPTPAPIFGGSGLPAVAGVAVPLAPTHAAYTEGLSREPNQFVIHGDRGRLVAQLDYNPLKPGQGPLRNELAPVTQAAAPAGSSAAQPVCCPMGFPIPRPQPIGASLLRVFDQISGLPLLGADGRPQLLRSPVPAVVIAIVVHIDETTHGISAGIPIPPIPGIPATAGDHYTLGLFDLRALHLE